MVVDFYLLYKKNTTKNSIIYLSCNRSSSWLKNKILVTKKKTTTTTTTIDSIEKSNNIIITIIFHLTDLRVVCFKKTKKKNIRGRRKEEERE